MQNRNHRHTNTLPILLICIVFFSVGIYSGYQVLKRKYNEQIICEFNLKSTVLIQEFEKFKKQYSNWPSLYLWIENNFPQSNYSISQKTSSMTTCIPTTLVEYDDFLGSYYQKQNLLYEKQLFIIDESKNKIKQKWTELKAEIPDFFQDVHKLCYFQQKFNHLDKLSLSIDENCKSNQVQAHPIKNNSDKKNTNTKFNITKNYDNKKEKNCKLADEKLLLKKEGLLSTLTENTQKVKIKWPFFSETLPALISHCENSHEWKIFE